MTRAIQRMAFRPAATVATLWSATSMFLPLSLMSFRLMMAAGRRRRERERERERERGDSFVHWCY